MQEAARNKKTGLNSTNDKDFKKIIANGIGHG